MKPKGWLYCGGAGGGAESCRLETKKPHWHRVYESCFETPDGREQSFIDWELAADDETGVPVMRLK